MEADDLAAGRDMAALGSCPFTIDRPVMGQRWEQLTFLHWPYDPADVQRLLPDGLHVDTFGGAAWVGLVPFFMRVRTAGGLRAPWASDFCETTTGLRASGSCPSTQPASALWWWPAAPTGCRTSGPRCG
jgi:hypothetical protein